MSGTQRESQIWLHTVRSVGRKISLNANSASWPAIRSATDSAANFQHGAPDTDERLSGMAPTLGLDQDRPVSRRGPLKFFLVEDNVIIRENLAETLHEMVGAEVVGISDGQSDATQWLCDPAHDWDVAVVDIFLKRGNGVNVVAALQRCKRQHTIIVLSNYASPEVRKECLRLGADAVFDKSTELDNLIAFCAGVGSRH